MNGATRTAKKTARCPRFCLTRATNGCSSKAATTASKGPGFTTRRTMAAAPAIITRNTFTLTDKLKIQQQRIRDKQYVRVGPLTTIVIERQLPTAGISQSKPRWQNREQEKIFNRDKNFAAPFSQWQMENWVLLTLDWLTHTKAPQLAVSADRN